MVDGKLNEAETQLKIAAINFFKGSEAFVQKGGKEFYEDSKTKLCLAARRYAKLKGK